MKINNGAIEVRDEMEFAYLTSLGLKIKDVRTEVSEDEWFGNEKRKRPRFIIQLDISDIPEQRIEQQREAYKELIKKMFKKYYDEQNGSM